MTFRKRVRNALESVLPGEAFREIEMRFGRRRAVRWLRDRGVLDLGAKVAEHFDYTVQCGPFRGMHYTRGAVQTHHVTPNLLGTYEQQLYPYLEEAAIRSELIVDIGSAEGYFAVGLARLTGRRVVAFDVNRHERQLLAEMASVNRVSHLITVSKWCSAAGLVDLVRGKRALVFCDIEGGEFSLFTSDVLEALSGCDVFIELHGTPEGNGRFLERFAGRKPVILDHPIGTAGAERLAFLGSDAARMATEYRTAQQWLVLRPRDLSSLEQLGASLREPAAAMERDPVNSK